MGSLREEVRPLDLVIPDQLIDRTRLRDNTFFGDGVVAHIAFADPFCPHLSGLLADVAQEAGGTVHQGGACIVMEGPAFSTKAESHMYRSWNASIIGMTALPEAKLAREAELCYAMLACVTDYDVWHESEEQVSVELIVANLQKNAATSQQVLRALVPRLDDERECGCPNALENGIITAREHITQETTAALGGYNRQVSLLGDPRSLGRERNGMATHGRQEPGEPYRRISVGEAAELQQQGALVVDVRNPRRVGVWSRSWGYLSPGRRRADRG